MAAFDRKFAAGSSKYIFKRTYFLRDGIIFCTRKLESFMLDLFLLYVLGVKLHTNRLRFEVHNKLVFYCHLELSK